MATLLRDPPVLCAPDSGVHNSISLGNYPTDAIAGPRNPAATTGTRRFEASAGPPPISNIRPNFAAAPVASWQAHKTNARDRASAPNIRPARAWPSPRLRAGRPSHPPAQGLSSDLGYRQ